MTLVVQAPAQQIADRVHGDRVVRVTVDRDRAGDGLPVSTEQAGRASRTAATATARRIRYIEAR